MCLLEIVEIVINSPIFASAFPSCSAFAMWLWSFFHEKKREYFSTPLIWAWALGLIWPMGILACMKQSGPWKVLDHWRLPSLLLLGTLWPSPYERVKAYLPDEEHTAISISLADNKPNPRTMSRRVTTCWQQIHKWTQLTPWWAEKNCPIRVPSNLLSHKTISK